MTDCHLQTRNQEKPLICFARHFGIATRKVTNTHRESVSFLPDFKTVFPSSLFFRFLTETWGGMEVIGVIPSRIFQALLAAYLGVLQILGEVTTLEDPPPIVRHTSVSVSAHLACGLYRVSSLYFPCDCKVDPPSLMSISGLTPRLRSVECNSQFLSFLSVLL